MQEGYKHYQDIDDGYVIFDAYGTGSGLTPQDALLVQKYLLKLISKLPE